MDPTAIPARSCFRASGARRVVAVLLVSLAGACPGLAGCSQDGFGLERELTDYRDRMLQSASHQPPTRKGERSAAAERRDSPLFIYPADAEQAEPPRESLMVQPPPASQPTLDQVEQQVPDPVNARTVWERRLKQLWDEYEGRIDKRPATNYEKVVNYAKEYLAKSERGKRSRLTLAEVVQRTLEHNYIIRGEAYNPAISEALLVEAEAAFDAVFFLDPVTWNTNDPAEAFRFSQLGSDERILQTGFRQLLPTGMQVSTSVGGSRTFQKVDTTSQAAFLNPTWTTNFTASFRQPLLRGFGLDVNRAQINLRAADRDIARDTYLQQVRDTLLNVENTYWELMYARRNVAILAETVAQNRVTYENIVLRGTHDATLVERANAFSRWKQREVQYIDAIKSVRDLEDQLKNLMNDPEYLLSEGVDLVPSDTLFAMPLALDQFGEVRTALDSRSEIQIAKRRIDQARISTQVAKNQALPQLDLSFQYTTAGLDNTFDNSYDELIRTNYNSYSVSVSFSIPVGNRGPLAEVQRTRLVESQALVALQQVTDTIVQEVNSAVRSLLVRYIQITPQFLSVESAETNLRALQARTPRIDPTYLDTELTAVQNLASTRQLLLRVLIDYNTSIAALEKAKGTLLQYNNISVADVPAQH